jgi:hypothetical protein
MRKVEIDHGIESIVINARPAMPEEPLSECSEESNYQLLKSVAIRHRKLRHRIIQEPLTELMDAFTHGCCNCNALPCIGNALCLRVTLHRLFQSGLIAITKNYRIMVSTRLRGTSYWDLRGKLIELRVDYELTSICSMHGCASADD